MTIDIVLVVGMIFGTLAGSWFGYHFAKTGPRRRKVKISNDKVLWEMPAGAEVVIDRFHPNMPNEKHPLHIQLPLQLQLDVFFIDGNNGFFDIIVSRSGPSTPFETTDQTLYAETCMDSSLVPEIVTELTDEWTTKLLAYNSRWKSDDLDLDECHGSGVN